jgi:hypothetical protein
MIQPPKHWVHRGIVKPEGGEPGQGVEVFDHALIPLRVIRSIAIRDNGERWFHLSVSRRSAIPSWSDMMKVKNEFLGLEVEAYQVMPRAAEYVNVNEFCLHFFAPIDGHRCVINLLEVKSEELVNILDEA